MTKKTRNLSLFEYLEALQLEYINAELRKKIYPIIKDKKFYTRTMSYKREKIEDIAGRNKLPTIFNDDRVNFSLYEKIYTSQYGLPNFMYRNTREIDEFRKWDIINYFAKGAEVKVKVDKQTDEIGTIVDNTMIVEIANQSNIVVDPDRLIVKVKLKGQEKSSNYLIKHICRIL